MRNKIIITISSLVIIATVIAIFRVYTIKKNNIPEDTTDVVSDDIVVGEWQIYNTYDTERSELLQKYLSPVIGTSAVVTEMWGEDVDPSVFEMLHVESVDSLYEIQVRGTIVYAYFNIEITDTDVEESIVYCNVVDREIHTINIEE